MDQPQLARKKKAKKRQEKFAKFVGEKNTLKIHEFKQNSLSYCSIKNPFRVGVGFSRSWREKKKCQEKPTKICQFCWRKKKQKETDFDLFQKKKSQVIFLASQFFFLAGIRLFWLSLPLVSRKNNKKKCLWLYFLFPQLKKKRPRKLLG